MAAAILFRFSSSSSSQTIKSSLFQAIRPKSTASRSISSPHHHHHHHDFSPPCEFLSSWKPPTNPKEAEKQLAMLRKDYDQQVKELRHHYIYEMELQRQEKQRKDEAKREAIRLAKEERKAAKAAAAKTRAEERKVFEEEFRQTLLKERAKKLENWGMKEERREQKKGEKNKLLHQQSSMWIDEKDLEKRIVEVFLDTTPM